MPLPIRWTVPAYHDLKRELSYVEYENPQRVTLVAQNIKEAVQGCARFLHLDQEGRIEGTRELGIPSDPYVCICRIDADAISILRLLPELPRMIRHGQLNYDTPWTPFDVAEETARIVGVRHDSWMQDWPIEVSDSNRIEEFIAYAEKEDRKEHFLAMMTLILDSFPYDRPLSADILSRIQALVMREPSVMGYWLSLDSEADDEGFPATPWIRKICERQ